MLNKNYSIFETLHKDIKNYFQNEYIISKTSIKEEFEINFLFYIKNSDKFFIQMDNNMYVSCFNNYPNIILINLNNLYKEKISFKAHWQKTNCIIKTNINNLITCGDDGIIKIWPNINENIFSVKLKILENIKNPYLRQIKL